MFDLLILYRHVELGVFDRLSADWLCLTYLSLIGCRGTVELDERIELGVFDLLSPDWSCLTYLSLIGCSGAVALDGRIEPGDMILEVNGISFENLSNDEAVRTLRESVHQHG